MAASNEEREFGRKPKIIKSVSKSSTEKRLIVVLERASLETVKTGKSYELLNCDRHKHLSKKFKKDISQCRPDITHQCLLMLMDSPLNRAGLLQVYIHTENNVLIEINPQTRIPRTFERFCGLMVQLLHKLSIHASDGPQKLLKVIKNPVTDHLPVGCTRLGTSFQAEEVVNPRSVVPKDSPMVVVIGAMAHGKVPRPAPLTWGKPFRKVLQESYKPGSPGSILLGGLDGLMVDIDYVEKSVSVSNYPLSAALTCAKFCSAFEEEWGVI